jgi:spoIIIJ-associated protein
VEWVETTGRSIDEAKDLALDQLGVDEQEAEFEILEEPTKGLFGRTRGEARVRARIQPKAPPPKVERRERRRTSAKKSGSRQSATAAEAGSDAASTVATDEPAPTRTRGRGRSTTTVAATTDADDATTDAPSEAPAAEAPPARSTRGSGRGAKKSSSAPRREPSSPAPERSDMSTTDVTVQEQADIVREFLEGLVEAFGVEGTLEQEQIDEDTIEVKVVGDDLGLLIGPKGNTLVAVQELARTVVQRQASGTHHGRVRIDVGGYRQRRREALERFTQQVAEQVKESGLQKALEPMAASDRKVVHDTVNAIDGVRTLSEGEEPRRRVVIAPE